MTVTADTLDVGGYGVGAPPPTIYELWPRVMAAVGTIGKSQRNTEQNFMFRGIDDVMAALHGVLIDHGVFYMPEVIDRWEERYETKRGTAMKNVAVRVRYTFYGPRGDSVVAVAEGEAADSGDKATGKAQSVALKFALLHALCSPTRDQPDPDAESHERAAPSASSEADCPGCNASVRDGKPVERHDGVMWHKSCWSERPM